ncbi:transposase domain-containing protein, partial [Bradyrhizobium sp. 168]|uniref:transposase domain-containing protein n=1 Tax=Bradyrhizobium sp. 168 TaxID=2782639 RepID=UPI001FF9D272
TSPKPPLPERVRCRPRYEGHPSKARASSCGENRAYERSIRGIKLSRKNALFAGSDGGAEHWAVVATLVETCKLNDVDPLAYLTDVLTRIVNGHPNRDIDQLLPWGYRAQALKAVG